MYFTFSVLLSLGFFFFFSDKTASKSDQDSNNMYSSLALNHSENGTQQTNKCYKYQL